MATEKFDHSHAFLALRHSIKSTFIIMDDVVVGFSNIIDRAKFGRKFMLYFSLYLTWTAYQTCSAFAFSHPEKSGTEIGLVIAAVLVPIGWLVKVVVENYLQSTQAVNNDAPNAPNAKVSE